MLYGGIYYSVVLSNKKGSNNREIIENQSKGPFKYIYSVIIAFISSFLMSILVQSIGSVDCACRSGDRFHHWTTYFDGLFEKFIIWTYV